MLILIIWMRNVKKTLEYTAYDQRSVMGGRQGYSADSMSSPHTSVLDYGSIAYNSTSLTNKLKLDKIQSKALRIICGAFCSTSIAAMQVECGEMPKDSQDTARA